MSLSIRNAFSTLSQLSSSIRLNQTSMKRAIPSSSLTSFQSFKRNFAVRTVQNDEELRQILKENEKKLVIVDWSASWCGPCRTIAPVYEEWSNAPENKNVVFVKVDIDELPDASAEARVESVPTFHFIKGQNLVDEQTGADQQRLVQKIQKHR